MATAELELPGKNNGASDSANGNVAGGSDVDLQMLLSALTALRKRRFLGPVADHVVGAKRQSGRRFQRGDGSA